MKTVKALISIMALGLVVVGCEESSKNNNVDNGNQIEQSNYQRMISEVGTYNTRIVCEDKRATMNLPLASITFTLEDNGQYTQEVRSLDKYCRKDCWMRGYGTYVSTLETITFNQTQLNSRQGIVQGERSTTFTRTFVSGGKSGKVAILGLMDEGNSNACGGPMEMRLYKQNRYGHY